MTQYKCELGDEYLKARSLEDSKKLIGQLEDFDEWVEKNKDKFYIEK